MSPESSVGVVIPAYRAEATIDAALASVAAQTVPVANIVVVDDASGDATSTIARRWCDRLPLEVVTLDRNCGPAGARRAAVERLDTEAVALLDADDVWLPDHVNTMLAAYAGPESIVCAHELRWMPGVGLGCPPLRVVPPPARQLEVLLRRNFVFVAAVFARERYALVGGFRDGVTGAEDWDLWIRLVRAGGVVRPASHPTVLYRLSRESVSADDRSLESDIKVLQLAVAEGRTQAERRAARSGLRLLHARVHLVAAYGAGRDGRRMLARHQALRALGGGRSLAIRAAGILAAPVSSVRARDERKWSKEQWLAR
jgi:glycosyltransferase involved in cell wall biosynthesis